jgi:hypothetical protein
MSAVSYIPRFVGSAREGTILTRHATARMVHRGIHPEVIKLVIEYGRTVYTRGAVVYAIGRKEVERYRQEDLDLSDCEGVQVVCSMADVVLTVYRNRDFRGLRTGLGRGRFRPAGAGNRRLCMATY